MPHRVIVMDLFINDSTMWNVRYLEEFTFLANKSSAPTVTERFPIRTVCAGWWLVMRAWTVWDISHLWYFPTVHDVPMWHCVNRWDGYMRTVSLAFWKSCAFQRTGKGKIKSHSTVGNEPRARVRRSVCARRRHQWLRLSFWGLSLCYQPGQGRKGVDL